jgi:HAD superfamily hydrolase (TIGR01509 family)
LANVAAGALKQQLLIFDCDGVLVDSEVISNEVLARMLTEAGLPTTLPEARAIYQGMLLGDILREAEARLGSSLPEGWLAEYEHQRGEEFRRDLKPVPGAAELVSKVKAAGIEVCVASQGKLEKTRLSLELTGLRDLFGEHALFSAHSVARGKPAPDLFLHAAAEMGAQPQRCVVVEDTPSGVMAAASAGMLVFGYAADSDEKSLRSAGAWIVHELSDVAVQLRL